MKPTKISWLSKKKIPLRKPTTIREVLNPLINLPTEFEEKVFGKTCMICGFPFSKKEREEYVAQAVAQIKEIFKSVVGENKDELKNLDINNPIRKFYEGYNLRGNEITKRIEKQ